MQRKFHPVAAIFRLLEGEEFADLVASIKANGLLNPIWLHPDGRIIDGRNRERACAEAGVEPRYQTWNGKGSLTEFVFDQNYKRRHLNATEKALAAKKAEPFFAHEAKERQRAAGREFHRGKRKVSQRIDKPNENRAAARAAKVAKSNRQYVADLKRIEKESPQVYAKIEAGELELPKAKQEIKQQAKLALAERIMREPAPAPTGPYRVQAIDPPWPYASRADDPTHRAGNPYPAMTLDKIKALPIAEYAHPDSILWLWTTNAFIGEALECLAAWGFEKKTILTWVKDKMGTGDWLRGRSEHCIMAARGDPVRRPLTNQTTVITGPLREFARKPDEFYALVESLCPGNKAEWFARQEREGWTAIMSPELGKFVTA
jgi:N6-adenosine-specific RNA methylase IME4